MIKKIIPLFILATFALGACTAAQYAPVRLGQDYPTRTAPEAIEVFRSSTPNKKYIEIGAVRSCCSNDTNAMVDLLRKKAPESGGDAIIDLDMRANGGVTATVIRYQ